MNTSKTFYCIVLILVVVRSFRCTLSLYYILLDMHPLAAASRSRLLETEAQLFVLETSYYMRSVDDIAVNLSLRKSKREWS